MSMSTTELADLMESVADELGEHGYECLAEENRYAADSLRGKA